MKYKLKMKSKEYDLYVEGFSRGTKTVRLSRTGKEFTRAGLNNFISKYSDAGYGFHKRNFDIVEVL